MKRTANTLASIPGAAFALILAAGCATTSPVTRMVGGHRIQGRFVRDEAYAAYLKGVVLETRGQTQAAMAAYDEAIQHDPDSVELWTRLGALRCAEQAKPGAPNKTRSPWEAFAHASDIDPSYEETWTERARCHLKRGQLDDAAYAARIAVALDPNRGECAILLASILERQGNEGEARRWLDGLVVREPTSIEAHEAMAAFAARTHDERRLQAASEAVAALRPPGIDGPRPRGPASLADVDAALSRGDFDRARHLALAARLSSGSLALRAAAIGSATFAGSQAELVLAADPADGDARTAAMVAADLKRDDAAFSRALFSIPQPTSSLSPLATVLLGELLRRRVGPEAHAAWLRATGTVDATQDSLVRKVESRR